MARPGGALGQMGWALTSLVWPAHFRRTSVLAGLIGPLPDLAAPCGDTVRTAPTRFRRSISSRSDPAWILARRARLCGPAAASPSPSIAESSRPRLSILNPGRPRLEGDRRAPVDDRRQCAGTACDWPGHACDRVRTARRCAGWRSMGICGHGTPVAEIALEDPVSRVKRLRAVQRRATFSAGAKLAQSAQLLFFESASRYRNPLDHLRRRHSPAREHDDACREIAQDRTLTNLGPGSRTALLRAGQCAHFLRGWAFCDVAACRPTCA